MNWLSFAVVLSALLGLTISHEYDETIDTQQPFVGWTKDDLNAKWGTDVSQMHFRILRHE